jgi:RNA polymerase sigma factor (sigma-70 family)
MNPPPAEGLTSRLFLGPALRTQPDRRLVTLVRDGYEVAFEEIVRRYGKALGRYASAIVGARSEEVTQDAFSKALLALRGMDGDREIELRPWLYRIVRNTALNDLRDRPPEAAELAEGLAGGRSAAEEMERREELAQLLERLRALPEPQRAAIVMRELEGLGHEEIAAALGLSGGAARQAIYRARQALRDGIGLMIPLPALRAMIDHGVEAGTAAAGAGGAVAAGGAMGGAGTALKVGVVTAVLAGGIGTGLALKDRAHHRGPETAAAATVRGETDGGDPPAGEPSAASSGSPSVRPGEGVGGKIAGAAGSSSGSVSNGEGLGRGEGPGQPPPQSDGGGRGHGSRPPGGHGGGGEHPGGPGGGRNGGRSGPGGRGEPGPEGFQPGSHGGRSAPGEEHSGPRGGESGPSGDVEGGEGGEGGRRGTGGGDRLPPPPPPDGSTRSSDGPLDSSSDDGSSTSGS